MPTGYTADVVSGKIDTVKEFTALCVRAFGATIHMRDDSLATKYTPRVVPKYMYENVKEAKRELAKFQKKSLASIKKDYEKQLKAGIAETKTRIAEINVVRGRLERLISEIEKIKFPKSHAKLKEFMISQLAETIKWDGDPSYHIESLENATKSLETPFDAKKYKAEKIKSLKERIKRYEQDVKKETKLCNDCNKWVTDLEKIVSKMH